MPEQVFAGDPVTVTGSAMDMNPAHPLRYEWRRNGQLLPQHTSTITLATHGLPPGELVITGTASQGSGDSATCTERVVIRAFEPPTVSCSASPSTVTAGGPVTITTVAVSPQDRPLHYSYSSSAGNVSGSSALATLSTAVVPNGTTITVNCNVVDDLGQTAAAQTTVQVSSPLGPPTSSAPLQCTASPTVVRAGLPVQLSAAVPPSIHVTWRPSDGSMDRIDPGSGRMDTAGLPTGTVSVQGEVEGKTCTAHFIIDPRALIADSGVSGQVHGWMYPVLNPATHQVQRYKAEAAGYAVYTYVLARSLPQSDDDKKRFRNLVAAVLGGATADQTAPQNDDGSQTAPTPQAPGMPTPTPHDRLTIVYLPVTAKPSAAQEHDADWNMAKFDVTMAATLIARLQCPGGCDVALKSDGPFLVSTIIPLSRTAPRGVLVVNLSGTTPDTAGQWVNAVQAVNRDSRNWTGRSMARTMQAVAIQLDLWGQGLEGAKTAQKAVASFFPWLK